MFDLTHLIMRRAVEGFQGERRDNVFTAAWFSECFAKMTQTNVTLDGRTVEVMLCGRPDVVQLKGGSHYQLVEHVAR